MVGLSPHTGAICVAANFECVEVHLQGVVHQQATDEWIPLTEYEFDNFCGLHEANCAGQNTQHARFVSRWGPGLPAVARGRGSGSKAPRRRTCTP